jgi:putative hydrolases of HD superfamily
MILDFFKTIVNLKKISRQGWIDKVSIKNPESVADHSYSMAMISMVISDLENYDSEKILKMVLLHDLAESKIGDFTPEQIDIEKKIQLENTAFNEIIGDLPDSIKKQYLEIWQEYQENISPESKIIHQIDKLEMVLQAKTYQNEGYSKEKLETFFESAKIEITHPKLKELFTKIVNDL